jgi:hypothetical protein
MKVHKVFEGILHLGVSTILKDCCRNIVCVKDKFFWFLKIFLALLHGTITFTVNTYES